jgi:hypothetical protein
MLWLREMAEDLRGTNLCGVLRLRLSQKAAPNFAQDDELGFEVEN